ncbi:hypothetical protein ACS2TU_27125, partial [Bacillus cereus group sp. BC41]|uniref:hypothetical protein n=1 Tax=Bacillus cereus group sp. BC41 TaxID=3445301 RepID=UPI003F216751
DCGDTTHRHRFAATLNRIARRKYHAFETFTTKENNVSRQASGRRPRHPYGAGDARSVRALRRRRAACDQAPLNGLPRLDAGEPALDVRV